jgi:hypothetical protein
MKNAIFWDEGYSELTDSYHLVDGDGKVPRNVGSYTNRTIAT